MADLKELIEHSHPRVDEGFKHAMGDVVIRLTAILDGES